MNLPFSCIILLPMTCTTKLRVLMPCLLCMHLYSQTTLSIWQTMTSLPSLHHFKTPLLLCNPCKALSRYFTVFFMTQKPIKNDPANYSKVLSDAIDNKYRLKDTRVMDPAFLKTEEYRNYQNTVKKKYETAKRKVSIIHSLRGK